MSKYIKKEFSPHLFHDWTHLFRTCTTEQRSELLLAITDFPNYEPAIDVPIWTFIKSQLENQYRSLETKSQQMSANRNNGKQKTTEDDKRQPKTTEDDKGRQTGIKTGTGIEIKTGTEKTVAEIIKQAGDALSVRKSTDMIFVDSSFRLLNYPVFAPYIEQVTPAIIESVENWLRQTKNGQSVSVQFITKQFFNFANRQNKSVFK